MVDDKPGGGANDDGTDGDGANGDGTRERAAGSGTDSVLESVVVHAVGAVCVRRARCRVPAGVAGTVRIEGLPLTAAGRSLRARVRSGPAGVRVTDVRLDLDAEQAGAVPGSERSAVRLDLEDAQDRESRLRDRAVRLRAEIEEVAAFRPEPPPHRRGEPPRRSPVESILSLAGFVDTRLAALQERLNATEDERERAEHQVDVLARRLESGSDADDTPRVRTRATAVLTLSGDGTAPQDTGADADIELELEYHVPGATWSPVYQLRLDGGGTAGTLVMRAAVAQRTGEDWNGVRLGLSTADLLRRTDLPELRSLRIGRSQAGPAAHGWREPPPGLAELFTGYDAAVAARPARGRKRTASVWLGAAPDEELECPGRLPVAAAAPAAPAPDGFGGYGGAPAEPAGYGFPMPSPVPPPAPGGAPAPSQRPGGPPRFQPLQRSAAPRQPVERHTAPGLADTLLDYAGLELAGAGAPAAQRGTLLPGTAGSRAVADEHTRRAEAVQRLERPAHAVDVRSAAGAFDYRYDTAAPVDVVSDGAWHTVPVCEIPVTTAPAYVCVPAVDPAVYATVEVTNTSRHALLAGPADIVVDGDFVLTAALPTLAPGQRQAVGTGVVESIRVARSTHLRESTAGLRGGTTVLDHTVEVEIANRLPHPVTVEVRERVPVSDDKDVKVEDQHGTPAWTTPAEPLPGQETVHVRGARLWHAEVAAGATVTLTGGFAVRLPAGKAVVGGNRRN